VKRDGRVGVIMNKAEIGQGVTAAFATLVAEDLDVAVEAVDLAFADSHPEYRTSSRMYLTGGSTSPRGARNVLASTIAGIAGSSNCDVTSGALVGDRIEHDVFKDDALSWSSWRFATSCSWGSWRWGQQSRGAAGAQGT